jgi:kynurenine formamidase
MVSQASRFGRLRVQLYSWALVLAGGLLPAPLAGAQGMPPAISAPQLRPDLAYGPASPLGADPQRRLDLYVPARAPLAAKDAGVTTGSAPPLLIYIHGGAWVSGDKRQYSDLGAALSRHGVMVAIINYRLSGDGGVRHPAHAQDAAAAVAWLRRNAADLGFDKSRMFIAGHSAGAHIAALLAYDPSLLAAVGERPDIIRGYIGLEGIYDLPELVRRFPSYRVDFLQVAFGSDETTWRGASPQHMAMTHRRPWLLIHSQNDELVDVEQSRRFKAALESKSVPTGWVLLSRGSHFGVIRELTLSQSPLVTRVLDFLR